MDKPILIIKNHATVVPGTVVSYMDDHDLLYSVVNTYDNEPLPEIDSVRAIINLGSPHSVTNYREHEFLHPVFSYVCTAVRLDKPLLGICFGAQLLAHALGAKVTKNKVNELGSYRVRLTEAGRNNGSFAGCDDEFPVLQWHGDTFAIPFGCNNLAESDSCTNQAFRKGNLIGIQFHPEMDKADMPEWCATHKDEIEAEGKTVEQMIINYDRIAEEVKQLNYRLLDNFLSLAE